MLLDLHPQIPREKTHGPRSSIQEEQEHRAINLHRAGSGQEGFLGAGFISPGFEQPLTRKAQK